MKKLKLLLKELRLSKKISVPQLAEKSGVSRRTIQDMEKRGDGRLSTALKLSKALGVTLDKMCEDDGNS